MVSNVSFCCVEGGGETAEFVIALKSYVIDNLINETFAISSGTVYPDEILEIGYNNYVSGTPATYDLVLGEGDGTVIGAVDVEDYFITGDHWLEVTIAIETSNSWWINDAWHLYVGSKLGLDSYLDTYVSDPSKDILEYYRFPFGEDGLGTTAKTSTVYINYNDITE